LEFSGCCCPYSSARGHAKALLNGFARHRGLRPLRRYDSVLVSQPAESPFMSTCVFIQIRCRPGTTYRVAEEIALREIHSELYSTSGDFDLLMKLYIPKGEDVGVYINDHLLDIDGIERSLTTMTFKVF
jgi:DNA-binding Lrp family transcriptional regulator|tara:strand:+ start:3701 stop:4087 length:387 start_codon:yes stop_codon:yes gene_type:complete